MWFSKHNTRKMPRSGQRRNISCTTGSFLPAGCDCVWMVIGRSSLQIYTGIDTGKNHSNVGVTHTVRRTKAESGRFSDTRNMERNNYIQVVLGLNPGRDTTYLGSGSSHFSSVYVGKGLDMASIRSRPLHSKSYYHIHYSLVILPCNSTWSEVGFWQCRKIRHKNTNPNYIFEQNICISLGSTYKHLKIEIKKHEYNLAHCFVWAWNFSLTHRVSTLGTKYRRQMQ
jgi:hypothetical protein